MEIKDYNKIADVCLHADGGYCENCAIDVAKGFKKNYSDIDLDKILSIIKQRCDEYYGENKNGNKK